MASRRSLLTRATLLTRHRLSAAVPHLLPSDNDDHLKRRRHHPTPLFPFPFPPAVNSPFPFAAARNMSTEAGTKPESFADVAEVLSDGAADVAASVGGMSEVAAAAADSAYPVAALQYFIEGVHNFTGFNWWASIVLTTLLIRGATVPLLINQLKASTKLGLLRPELEAIKDEMQDKGMEPQAVAEGQKRMQALFNKYGVTPFTPLKGLLIQGPVFLSFFLAISNMVEKVPSFKQGGAFWFTDLTTPDSLYIFPVLTALSFWITVEFNMQEGMEGNPAAQTMKKVSRVFAAVTIPITMNFPKALFCYWVTSNLFSLMYGAVLKAPGVKQFLNIPEIPVAPPSTTANSGKPEFSFLESMKKYVAAQQHIHAQQTAEVLSQRVKGLESQVKSKNKNKKT